MANIKLKKIDNLSDWNVKELRKLKINLKNRISSFSDGKKPKELAKSHVLYKVDEEKCNEILVRVLKAEKILSKKIEQ